MRIASPAWPKDAGKPLQMSLPGLYFAFAWPSLAMILHRTTKRYFRGLPFGLTRSPLWITEVSSWGQQVAGLKETGNKEFFPASDWSHPSSTSTGQMILLER